MQLKTIKEIKLELKRLRRRQNSHQDDDKITRRKIKLRTMLWKLLREQPKSIPSAKPKRTKEAKEGTEVRGKGKGSGNYT